MLKFVVFCFLLWHGMHETSGGEENFATHNDPSLNLRNTNYSGQPVQMIETHKFNATQQIFNMNGPLLGRAGLNAYLNRMGKALDSEYRLTEGIGAHKVHVSGRTTTWNKAREICIEEGGHLAVIRSMAEERIVVKMMLEKSIRTAWLGFHDLFEEGHWVTIYDEPLSENGWAHWSSVYNPNPDNGNGGGQNCGQMMSNGGMDDAYCHVNNSFICKISPY